VYVGARDCPWCAKWKAEERYDAVGLTTRQNVTFIERDVASIARWRQAAAWPEDVRWIREDLDRRNFRPAAPYFALVEGRTIIAEAGETGGWRGTVRPALVRRLSA
jgi:hypothetical protein